MYIIVVGGGKTGTALVDLAVADGNDVVAIEIDQEKASRLSEQYDCLVLNEDATTNGTLREAGVDRADAVISTTNVDAVNIMTMLLAQEHGVANLLSVVHEPQHLPVFEKIGVNVIENPQRLVAENLYNAVQYPRVGDFVEITDETDLLELTVDEGVPVAGLSLAEAKQSGALPAGVLVVAVESSEGLRPPDGSTRLDVGAVVDVLVHEDDIDAAVEAFGADA